MCQLLAHRGYAARYPENSREAVRAAVAAGARNVEFDIQLSADRVPHLFHDADFRRTGSVDISIFAATAAEIAALPAGEPDRFGGTFAGVRAPTLATVVDDLREWPDVRAFVELKRQSIEQFGSEAVLDSVLPVLEPILQQCVIISFDADIVRRARERAGVPIGWVVREWSAATRARVEALEPEFMFCNVERLPPPPEELWPGPWVWVVYEIISADVARELVGRGAGMIETMAYKELAAALEATR